MEAGHECFIKRLKGKLVVERYLMFVSIAVATLARCVYLQCTTTFGRVLAHDSPNNL